MRRLYNMSSKIRLTIFSFIVALFLFSIAGTVGAFHSGGVAECMGCHNIHDAQSASSLLKNSDTTSTCAGGGTSCHGTQSAGSYHILSTAASMPSGSPPLNKTPGGDFGWLLKTYNDLGSTHGHNVVAADIPGFIADPQHKKPLGGGKMDANLLSCNSCHDNHGKLRRLSNNTLATTGAPIIGSGSYTNSAMPAAGQAVGVYRLLRGPGSGAGDGGMIFTAAFQGVVASTYNRAEDTAGTAMAYGKGTSSWCATCHPDMLSESSSNHTHPTNQGFSSTIRNTYNAYVGSGMTGNPNFDTIVPYANDNVTTLVQLQTDANNPSRDASTSSRVMCLSCHRAHASGFRHMTRWQNDTEFIAVESTFPGIDATNIASQEKYAMGRTQAETAAAYNRTATAAWMYASYQRSLCNKCHAKD